MLRATQLFAAAAAAAAAAPSTKMVTLHKLLTGETHFKNGALLKLSNVEFMFGANWRAELQDYASKLPNAQDKATIDRQVQRLLLTNYTTRELAKYGGEGAAHVAHLAKAGNLADGLQYLNKVGEHQFIEYVKQEAKLANWSEADADKFVASVKKAKEQNLRDGALLAQVQSNAL